MDKNLDRLNCRSKLWIFFKRIAVLNVHVNENKKNLLFSEGFFLSSSEKLTFEKENVIFFNTF